MSFWRAITSATVLIGAILALRIVRGRPFYDGRRPSRRAWGWLGVGVLAVTVQNLGIFGAFEQTTVVVALVVFYAYPVMIGLASAALGLERMDARRWVALIGAFAGCTLVVVGAGSTGDATAGGNVIVGAGMALVAAAAQTVYVLASRHGFASVPTPETVATLNLGPAMMILLLGLLAGDHGLDPTALTLQLATVYVLGAVLGQMVPMLLYQTGVRSIGPIDASTIAFAEPFFAAIVALVVVGQAFTLVQVAGGVLVAGSALVVQRRG